MRQPLEIKTFCHISRLFRVQSQTPFYDTVGTLIAPGWALCASHCFGRDNKPSNFKVKVGDLRINGDDGSEKGTE